MIKYFQYPYHLKSLYLNPEKTESEEIKLVSGHNCNPLTAAEEMQNLVAYWKEKRRMQDNNKDAYHLIQSFCYKFCSCHFKLSFLLKFYLLLVLYPFVQSK